MFIAINWRRGSGGFSLQLLATLSYFANATELHFPADPAAVLAIESFELFLSGMTGRAWAEERAFG